MEWSEVFWTEVLQNIQLFKAQYLFLADPNDAKAYVWGWGHKHIFYFRAICKKIPRAISTQECSGDFQGDSCITHHLMLGVK